MVGLPSNFAFAMKLHSEVGGKLNWVPRFLGT